MQAGRSGDQDNPLVPAHCRMRVYDRDLIRGGHYGQRSCEPHLQAEHMAAPTNAAKREESSCQLGAALVAACPLSGVKRKLDFGSVRSANDPGYVKTPCVRKRGE